MVNSKKCFRLMMLLLLTFIFLTYISMELKAESTTHDIGNSSLVIGTDDGDYVITGSTNSNSIVVQGGEHNITLKNVHISVVEKSNKMPAFSIKKGASVNLTLEGVSSLASGKDMAGLQVPEGASLVINKNSKGRLLAYGNFGGAGIGGNYKKPCGKITIDGGEILASSVKYSYLNNLGGAGIGGGYGGSGGSITINGGWIMASGDKYGAGIGGGFRGSGGSITINGGSILAEGGESGSGIGGGKGGDGNNIVINGGIINAYGGKDAAAIGGGRGKSGGTIMINSCSLLYAEAGENGAGIGGGYKGSGGSITVLGGNIDSIGGKDGAGIGGGYEGSGGIIYMKLGDNYLDATGSKGASAIGGGYKGASGTINIESGNISATRGSENAQCIGSGEDGDTIGVVTIKDGVKISYQSSSMTIYDISSIFTDSYTIIGIFIILFLVICIIALIFMVRRNYIKKQRIKQKRDLIK